MWFAQEQLRSQVIWGAQNGGTLHRLWTPTDTLGCPEGRVRHGHRSWSLKTQQKLGYTERHLKESSGVNQPIFLLFKVTECCR